MKVYLLIYCPRLGGYSVCGVYASPEAAMSAGTERGDGPDDPSAWTLNRRPHRGGRLWTCDREDGSGHDYAVEEWDVQGAGV